MKNKKYIGRKVAAGVLSAAMLVGSAVGLNGLNVTAATEHFNDASAEASEWENWKANWGSYSENYENVSLTPGANEKELNLAWYSKTVETPKIRVATVQDMNASNSVEFTGTQTAAVEIDGQQYYSNKVTVSGASENTTYYYQVYQNGAWQDEQKYSTKSFSKFSFLYVGDPQIGASKGQGTSESESLNAENKVTTTAEANLAARNDSYNWNKILNNAVEDHPDVSFMVSAGDQVNYGVNEREYAGYLGAGALKSLPVSTTIGNHDSGSEQYSMHFNNPNVQTEEQTTAGKTKAGTDYYYTYGNVLFIVLDTNNYNCSTHKNVMAKAVAENPNAKWRVVMFHQDIYGSGKDHSDSDGMVLRTQLTPLMDEFDIDVVLQGHDHTYSRTYQLKGDGKQHTAFTNKGEENFLEQNNCYEIVNNTQSGTVVNPEGTVYIEANSATGSKFYELIQTKQDYISERSQTWTPTYSVVSVSDDSFTIDTYDTATRNSLNGSSSYTIVKKATEESVALKGQAITGTDIYKKTVGSKAFKLDAKTSGDGTLSYRSSDEKVVKVDENGKVKICGIGKAKVTVTASATQSYETASMQVSIVVNPKQQSAKITANKKGSVTMKWNKAKNVSGYEVNYAYDKKLKSNAKTKSISAKKDTFIIKKLTAKKTVYIRVRSYKKFKDGEVLYGKYSATMKAKMK